MSTTFGMIRTPKVKTLVNMDTPKLKQLESLVEGLGGFDKVYSCGCGDGMTSIEFSYDDEDSDEYLEDDYEMIPLIVIEAHLSGKIYLNDIPVIEDLSESEIEKAFKYVAETDKFYYSKYNGEYYPHIVQQSYSDLHDRSEPFIKTDSGEIIMVSDLE